MSEALFSNFSMPCDIISTGFLIEAVDFPCIKGDESNYPFTTPSSHDLNKTSYHHYVQPASASPEAIILLSILFCVIGGAGTVGNLLVIVIILLDKKMRRSVTNLFIMNLAVADLFIMLFGIPEIAQFMMNKGWLLGQNLCRFQRSVLVCALYASVMTLMAVCVERYIAIVHPIKAHLLCSRKRSLWAITAVWPLSLFCSIPTIIFNRVIESPQLPIKRCSIIFPGDHVTGFISFKIGEFVLFFFVPVLFQSILYVILVQKLFIGTKDLHRKTIVRCKDGKTLMEKESGAITARKGVVKMLIACVLVYFFSYAPAQIPLIYNIISPSSHFPSNWTFTVCVITLSYINSAANPVLYSIFCHNFRHKFCRAICRCMVTEDDFSTKSRRMTFSMDTLRVVNTTTGVTGHPPPRIYTSRKISTSAVTVM